jgi:hypothetical protein
MDAMKRYDDLAQATRTPLTRGSSLPNVGDVFLDPPRNAEEALGKRKLFMVDGYITLGRVTMGIIDVSTGRKYYVPHDEIPTGSGFDKLFSTFDVTAVQGGVLGLLRRCHSNIMQAAKVPGDKFEHVNWQDLPLRVGVTATLWSPAKDETPGNKIGGGLFFLTPGGVAVMGFWPKNDPERLRDLQSENGGMYQYATFKEAYEAAIKYLPK